MGTAKRDRKALYTFARQLDHMALTSDDVVRQGPDEVELNAAEGHRAATDKSRGTRGEEHTQPEVHRSYDVFDVVAHQNLTNHHTKVSALPWQRKQEHGRSTDSTHNGRCLHGNVGTGANRKAQISSSECGRIVDAVSARYEKSQKAQNAKLNGA
jgi:hypothetical protein